MIKATKALQLPTTITGSLPRPVWYTENLGMRPFRDAIADARFREQYTDAVATYIRDQERADLQFERPEQVADLIRRALKHIPADRLILSSDCGFGREGMSRRIAFY